jgi:methylated-DNA-[protein]-cysteine S-methyltransferase
MTCSIQHLAEPASATYAGYHESPIGVIEVVGMEGALISLNFVEHARHEAVGNPLIEETLRQLSEYFGGKRREFALPLAWHGTVFQQQVWRQLLEIPYGVTLSYRDLARAIGKPEAVRAVGSANGKNPISIIVPCHRVIGSDGDLTGYGGGLWRKEWLLRHEGALVF